MSVTLNFTFTPGAGYTDPYTVVAFGNTNPSIPLGQKTISGYGSTITDNIVIAGADAPYVLEIYTDVCKAPVGTLNLP